MLARAFPSLDPLRFPSLPSHVAAASRRHAFPGHSLESSRVELVGKGAWICPFRSSKIRIREASSKKLPRAPSLSPRSSALSRAAPFSGSKRFPTFASLRGARPTSPLRDAARAGVLGREPEGLHLLRIDHARGKKTTRCIARELDAREGLRLERTRRHRHAFSNNLRDGEHGGSC